MSDINIAERLNRVREAIGEACNQHDREPSEITLLAVSKTKALGMIKAALQAGQFDFGENYLQEALEKISALQDKRAIWHFIGAIQSNKTKAIAEHFDWVHTVSSEKVARRLSAQRPANLAPLNVLIQVNIDADPNKSGLKPQALGELAKTLSSLPNLRLRGLMTVPAIRDPSMEPGKAFRELGALMPELQATLGLPDFDQLSMGMSADMSSAIAEGSTILRIGTAIFGSRS